MPPKVKTERLIENATPQQKERLLTLEGLRYNLMTTIAVKTDKHKQDVGRDKDDLAKIEADISSLIEGIESGQATLGFDEGGDKNVLEEVCPDCEGGGKDLEDKRKNCGTCKGKGTIPRSPKKSPGSG